MADPHRRGQGNDQVSGVKTGSQPLVIDPFNYPTFLGDNGGELTVTLSWIGASPIASGRAVPINFIHIMGAHSQVRGNFGGRIRLAAARAAKNMNARFQ